MAQLTKNELNALQNFFIGLAHGCEKYSVIKLFLVEKNLVRLDLSPATLWP
jgi:hypothetical protein